MAIRMGRPDDVEAVLRFWARAADGVSVSDNPIGVDRLLAHDPDALLIADHDGGVVGTVVAGWDGWRGHLYRLAVDPAHRRQGLARALLSAAHDRFTALGASLADAMVEDDNVDARAAYQALGYQRQHGRGRWVRELP